MEDNGLQSYGRSLSAMSAVSLALFSCVLQTAILYRLFPSQSTAVTSGSSVILYLLLLVGWKLYLWPFWFSPLRKLPEPPVSSLLCGMTRIKN